MPTGSVIGTVKDASGRVVPAAIVVLTNTQMGVSNSTTSNETGYYHFPVVLPGTYTVAVTHAGFKTVTQSCTVQATTSTTVDIRLPVGSTKQSVTVTGQPPLLNTRSGSLGTILPNRLIQNLLLNGRNPLMLVYLATFIPGRTTT